MGIFPVCMHKVDRKDADQTVQYVPSDQGLFLASAVGLLGISGLRERNGDERR